MKFKDLDSKMRIYETASDHCVLPGIFMVARLDGRGFTKLTKEASLDFDRPFDERFRDLMKETTVHLMKCGFKVRYAYSESDEISLLFDVNENSFGRKTRKINSVLAGEASAKFSILLGQPACFDCRVCELPNPRLVVDYFRWRNEDAFRNALNGYCYWLLRDQGKSARQATRELLGKNVAFKNELLFQNGINFNDVPSWQKRGFGLYWQTIEKEAVNRISNQSVVVQRNELYCDWNLPMRDEYGEFVSRFCGTIGA